MLNTHVRSKRGALGGLALLLASGSALVACGSGPNGPSAKTILSSAAKDAAAEGWVREQRVSSGPGQSLRGTNAIGLTAEEQHVVVDGSIASIIVLPNAAYVKGNEKALVGVFGITTKKAGPLAGKWIKIESSNDAYATLSSGATLVKHFEEYTVIAPLTEASDVTIDGQKALPISGHLTGPNNSTIQATMYVTTSGVVLPIELLIKQGTAVSTASWSAWGHAVSIVAPKTSIPFARVLH
jgi:hypothetical protein